MSRLENLRQWFADQPLARAFGMELEDLAEGCAAVRYTAREAHCVTNDAGARVVQGGIPAGVLADFAAVLAAMSAIPEGHTPLVHGSFSLHRPTLAGEEIKALARVFNASKTVISVRVIISGGGKLKASGDYHFGRPRESSSPPRAV